MIKFQKNNIVLGEDQITSNKVEGFIIYFSTPSKGALSTWLQPVTINPASEIPADPETGQEAVQSPESYNFVGFAVMGKNYSDTEFVGKDILTELHNIYIAELTTLNPSVTFESTLVAGA
jgi:hypothetical protein